MGHMGQFGSGVIGMNAPTVSLNVRMPHDMRAWLEARAAENERALGKEVVALIKAVMRDELALTKADPAKPKATA